jgi:hypothetical protein
VSGDAKEGLHIGVQCICTLENEGLHKSNGPGLPADTLNIRLRPPVAVADATPVSAIKP